MAMIAALKRCTTQNLTDDRSAKALRHPNFYDGQFFSDLRCATQNQTTRRGFPQPAKQSA
jgi:hypothetical protein